MRFWKAHCVLEKADLAEPKLLLKQPVKLMAFAGEMQEESPCERAGWVKSEESEGGEQSGSGLLPHSPPVPVIHDVLGENPSFLWAEREPSLSILLDAALPYSRRGSCPSCRHVSTQTHAVPFTCVHGFGGDALQLGWEAVHGIVSLWIVAEALKKH